MGSSQSEERTMFFTREKNDTPNQNNARGVFSRVQKKWYVQSKFTEFRARILSFYRLLQFSAPLLFEKIVRWDYQVFFFSLRRKVKRTNISELE